VPTYAAGNRNVALAEFCHDALDIRGMRGGHGLIDFTKLLQLAYRWAT